MNQTFGPHPLPGFLPVETPVGVPCLHCKEPVAEADSGVILPYIEEIGAPERPVAIHRECHIRMIVGSVGHQRGLCTCNGGPGTMDDPPGVSRRAAALAAEREFMGKREADA